MPVNKNALLRYNILDKCFRNTGRRYSIEDLLEEVNKALRDFNPILKGIRKRQLWEDIRFMKSEAGYGAPIVSLKDGRRSYLRYEDPSFSINNSPLNATEAEQLKNAMAILQRFEGAPQFEWVSELIPVLSDRFGLAVQNIKAISYDQNIDYSGYDKITPLFNAIVNQQVLDVVYEPFDKSSYKVRFHPYYLKQFNNRWFVFGLNEAKNINVWNMALDRIREIKQVKGRYRETDIDWEDYFYDIIGVTKPEGVDVQEIELLFTKSQAKYVYTKPLHPSQKAYYTEEGALKVTLKLIPNYELEMLLLSFGERVQILRPEHLKNTVKERLAKALENYS